MLLQLCHGQLPIPYWGKAAYKAVEIDKLKKVVETAEQRRKVGTFTRHGTSSTTPLSRDGKNFPDNNRWTQVRGRNDEDEDNRKVLGSIYESLKSQVYDGQQENSFPQEIEIDAQKATIVRAALNFLTESEFDPSQWVSAVIQQYSNEVQKTECNHPPEETRYSMVQHTGRYLLNTASLFPRLIEGGLPVKKQEEKKEILLSVGMFKHNVDILSPILLEKCTLMVFLKHTQRCPSVVAEGEEVCLAYSDRDLPTVTNGSSPLPHSSFSASGTVQEKEHRLSRLSSRTREKRLRMRKTTEKRYEEFNASSSSSEE